MDTSLAADWVTLVESHLLTYLLTPAQLNEMLCDFALSVRAKDGNDYEG